MRSLRFGNAPFVPYPPIEFHCFPLPICRHKYLTHWSTLTISTCCISSLRCWRSFLLICLRTCLNRSICASRGIRNPSRFVEVIHGLFDEFHHKLLERFSGTNGGHLHLLVRQIIQLDIQASHVSILAECVKRVKYYFTEILFPLHYSALGI